MSGERPPTPKNAFYASNASSFEIGEKVYYTITSDGKILIVDLLGQENWQTTEKWKKGMIIEKQSSEGSKKFKVSLENIAALQRAYYLQVEGEDGCRVSCEAEELRKVRDLSQFWVGYL